jgi:hypothetical protein
MDYRMFKSFGSASNGNRRSPPDRGQVAKLRELLKPTKSGAGLHTQPAPPPVRRPLNRVCAPWEDQHSLLGDGELLTLPLHLKPLDPLKAVTPVTMKTRPSCHPR